MKIGSIIAGFLLLTGTLLAESLFPNTDFETANPKTGFADGWMFMKGGVGTTDITLTADNVASGKNALKMEVRNVSRQKYATIWGCHYFQPALKTARKIRIRFRAAGEIQDGDFFAVFSANSKLISATQWCAFDSCRSSFPWKTIEKEFVLYPGTESLTLSFRACGTGTVWIDAVNAELLEETPVIRKLFSEPLSANGLPAGWEEKKYDNNENISAVRVEKHANGLKDHVLSACQQWKSGAEKSGFALEIPPSMMGKTVKISSWACCEELGRAVIGFELLDASGKQVKESLGVPSSHHGWFNIFHTATLPATGKVRILLLNVGQGTVWFDGVTILEDNSKKAVKLAVDSLECRSVPLDTSRERFGNYEFNTFADSPTKLSFCFKGVKEELKNPALCIDLPEDVKIGDAWNPHPGAINRASEKAVVTPIVRKEGRYRRWKYINPSGMRDIQPTYDAYMREMAVVFLPENQEKVKPSCKVFWHIENDGIAGREDAFTLNFLPPMEKTPNPKHFQFMRWMSEYLYIHDWDCFLASLKHLEECGYTWRQFRFPGKINDLFKAKGPQWKFFAIDGRGDNTVHFPKDLKIDGAARGLDGKRMPQVCPELYLNDPAVRAAYERDYTRQMKADALEPGDYFFMDNEDFAPMEWCFCERCRKAFAKKYGLTGVPDAKTILEKYADKWRDFRCEHGAKMIELVKNVIQKNFPGVLLADYDYHFDFTKPDWRNELYNVAKDPVMNEPFVDMHIVSFYHTHDAKMFDRIRSGRELLKKAYVPMCAVDSTGSYQSKNDLLTPSQFRLEILSAGVLGCDGFAIFPGSRIDGKLFLAADKAMAEIAILEDYFMKGKVVSDFPVRPLPYLSRDVTVNGKKTVLESPRWSQNFRSIARRLDKGTVVAILNFDAKENLFAEVALDKPLGNRKVVDRTNGKLYPLAKDTMRFIVRVPPMDACLLEIADGLKSDAIAPDQMTLRGAFEKEKADYLRLNAADNRFQPSKSGNLELAWGDANGDGEFEAVLKNSSSSLFIDLAHGGVPIDWRLGDLSLCARDQACAQLMFWDPPSIRGGDASAKHPVKTIAGGFENGRVFLTLERTMSEIPLRLRQTYSMSENSTGFKAETEFTNIGKDTIAFTPRLHNVFNPGNASNMNEACTIDYMSDGKFVRLDRKLVDGFLPVPGGQLTPAIRKSCYPFMSNGDKIRQFFVKQGFGIEAGAELSKLMCYFVYSGLRNATIEWIYNPVTLEPRKTFTIATSFTIYR